MPAVWQSRRAVRFRAFRTVVGITHWTVTVRRSTTCPTSGTFVAGEKEGVMFVVLVRHADPVAGGTDPGLSTAGQHRAVALANTLKDVGIKAIFTSELRRTKETAAPLASLLSITPAVIAHDPAAAANQIRFATRVLLIGHTNTVPPIIKALGGPADVVIGATEFDRLFVMRVPANGAESLLAMRYGK